MSSMRKLEFRNSGAANACDNLDSVMKRRSVLLLLVALLLPIRGALAAVGLFCHLDSIPPIAASQPHKHDTAADHASHHQPRKVHHDHSTGHDAPAQSDTCKYCAAVCSVPPVAPSELTLHEPVSPGGERFAAIEVSRSGPYPSGLERPPRTI